MFVNKARVCLGKAPFKCSPLGQAPGLPNKHETRLEILLGTNTLAYYEHRAKVDVKYEQLIVRKLLNMIRRCEGQTFSQRLNLN
jgi:hypothetical protein